MVVDHEKGHLKFVRSTLSTMVYPIQIAVNFPFEAANWLSESFSTRKSLLEENERLREEHKLISRKLQSYEILEAENKRLNELLGVADNFEELVLIAELSMVEMEPSRHLVEINKGTVDGVYEGQPVVDASGVIGQVYHVSPFSSVVLLITDPNHALPVQVNRNGVRAIAVGTGQNNVLFLEHLPTNADIKKGDLIISSGLGKTFPRGYPVGEVSEIMHEPGSAFTKVTIKTTADLTRGMEVLLVWPKDNRIPQLKEQETLSKK